jgi:phenylalanyl-tRNA synthetase beta chain
MICSEDELGLTDERQEGILELPDSAPLGLSIRDYLGKNDAILEIDNKAINHRPDLFSHIGVIREIQAIRGKKFDFKYEEKNLSSLPKLSLKNTIPEAVKRYIAIQVNNVSNIASPKYMTQVLDAFETSSK